VDVRQKTDLSPHQVTYVGGLPVTTPARTIVDMAAHLGTRRLAKLDSSVARDLTSYEAVLALLERVARRGKPGIRKLRTVMADRGGEPEPDASVLEERLIDLIDRGNLLRPTREFAAPWLAPTNGRVDLAYEETRLVVEADSRRWHTVADAFLTDRERDNRAQLAGWRVLRFTWWDIEERPEYVVSMIREALSL
jgi:hypothetical protein